MIENYADEHTDLERMTCICDFTEVDCFFDPYSQSLHFAYIGGQLVTEMLRDKVIQDFERQYEKACLRKTNSQLHLIVTTLNRTTHETL